MSHSARPHDCVRRRSCREEKYVCPLAFWNGASADPRVITLTNSADGAVEAGGIGRRAPVNRDALEALRYAVCSVGHVKVPPEQASVALAGGSAICPRPRTC